MVHEIEREITEEQYINATQNHSAKGIFTEQEVCGYGVYCDRYIEKDGKYYVRYYLGSSCD